MKKKINYSIILQIGLLLTFFLPFFPHGCLKPEQAAPATDSVAVDTAHIVADSTSIDNSSTIDSTSLVKNIEETDSVKSDSIYNSANNTTADFDRYQKYASIGFGSTLFSAISTFYEISSIHV